MWSTIFLLGRPGCGKSALYKLLAEAIRQEGLAQEVVRVDDFPILKRVVDRDVEGKRHIRAEGGFQITDRSLYDEVLKEVNLEVKKLQRPGRVVFVEFARDNYSQALQNFDRELLKRSLLVYVYCPFELCLKRNARRFRTKPKGLDEHIVPTDLMLKYYRFDDYEELYLKSEAELVKQAPAPVVVVKNDEEGQEKLAREARKVLLALKCGLAK